MLKQAVHRATRETEDLLKMLDQHSDIIVTDEVDEEHTEEILMDADGKPVRDDDSRKNLRGSIIGYIERLDTEFIKSLQHIDPHTTDYLDRMRDETQLYRLIVDAQKFMTKAQNVTGICRLIMLRIEHIYFKVTFALFLWIGEICLP